MRGPDFTAIAVNAELQQPSRLRICYADDAASANLELPVVSVQRSVGFESGNVQAR